MSVLTMSAEYTRQFLTLQILLAQAGVATSTQRLLRGRTRPTWSLPFEGIVQMMSLGTPDGEEIDAQTIRSAIDRVPHLPLPSDLEVTPVLAGGVPGEWMVVRGQAPERVLLYLHGGGYVSGSTHTHRTLTARLTQATDARTLAIDYRLAPEHPFPAAVEDAWAAYWWLLAQGTPPERIVVAGDSAGGGLAVALLLALRDARVPLPAAGVCLSPWFDLTLTGATLVSNRATDYLNLTVMRNTARMYLGEQDPHTPLASPLFADPAGLPPLLIQAGTVEMLFDDSRRFARRAVAAGVPVEFEPWENMVHVWHFLHHIAPAARQAINRVGCFVRDVTRKEVQRAYAA